MNRLPWGLLNVTFGEKNTTFEVEHDEQMS
jgi:hypothetical protein